MRVSAILLAAGRSTRMGRNKLLLPWEGSTVLRVVAKRLLASSAEEVVVVLGHEADRVEAELADLNVRSTFNRDFEKGMGSSLAFGVQAVHESAEAMLIALGDMPNTSLALIEALVARAAQNRIVVPRAGDREGNPVVFGAAFRSELQALQGDSGARSVIEAHRDRVTHVAWEESEEFEDLDTPADYS